MSDLTREQVKQHLDELSLWLTYPALDALHALDEADASLRAKLEAAQARVAKLEARLEIDCEYNMANERLEIDPSMRDAVIDGIACRDATISGLDHRVADLQQQLATAQNELCTAKDQIPPDLDGDSLSVALIKLKDQRRELQQALYMLTRKYDAEKAVAEAHEEVLTRERDRYRDLLEGRGR